MILKQVLEVYDILDKSTASGEEVKTYLQSYGGENIIVKSYHQVKVLQT